jgi:Tfp pilus assembly protein PilN
MSDSTSSNDIGGSSSVSVAMTATLYGGLELLWWIIIGVGVLLCLIALVFGGVCVSRKRNAQRQKEAELQKVTLGRADVDFT